MLIPISRKVTAWVDQGIITPAQGQLINEYEARTGGRSWVVFGVVGTGVTAILTGIVSLIAANWESIPQALKLAVYLLAQAGAGFAFLREEKKNNVWREAFLAIFVFLIWAGIGLYAQIFNLIGEGWPACLFWLTITLPAIALSRRPFLPHAWTVGLGITAIWWASKRWRGMDEVLTTMIVFSVPILVAAASFWAQSIKFLSPQFKTAFTFWGIGTYAIVGTVWGNVFWEQTYSYLSLPHVWYLAVPWAALALAVAGALARRSVPWNLRLTTAAFLLAIGVYLTIPFFLTRGTETYLLRQCIGAAGFLVIASLGAYLAAIDHQKRLFEIATQIIAIRFIVIYFQIFGDLTKTGFGLILSGVVILGVAYFWTRIKKTLFKKMGGAK